MHTRSNCIQYTRTAPEIVPSMFLGFGCQTQVIILSCPRRRRIWLTLTVKSVYAYACVARLAASNHSIQIKKNHHFWEANNQTSVKRKIHLKSQRRHTRFFETSTMQYSVEEARATKKERNTGQELCKRLRLFYTQSVRINHRLPRKCFQCVVALCFAFDVFDYIFSRCDGR